MEYELYLEVGDKPPPENQEIEINLRDPGTFQIVKVRAIISSKPDQLKNSDILWLFSTAGRKPEPWRIKILEKITEEETEVKVLPRRRLSLGERRGRMLEDLIREREEKKKGDK